MKFFFKEKRQHERFDYSSQVGVKTDTAEFECAALNISRGGILIKTGHALSLGERVVLTLPFPGIEEPLTPEGSVVRKARDCYGIQFVSPLSVLPL